MLWKILFVNDCWINTSGMILLRFTNCNYTSSLLLKWTLMIAFLLFYPSDVVSDKVNINECYNNINNRGVYGVMQEWGYTLLSMHSTKTYFRFTHFFLWNSPSIHSLHPSFTRNSKLFSLLPLWSAVNFTKRVSSLFLFFLFKYFL